MNGEQLKDEGMARAAENNKTLLTESRDIAVEIARTKGVVTADDVAKYIFPRKLGPAAGSLFRDRRFTFTGNRVKSTQSKNHARELKVWKLS